MGTAHVVATCNAPVDVAFAYLDDHRNVPEWMYGLKRFEPVGEQVQGLGAVFDGSVNFGATLHARVEVTGWEQDRFLELTSISGFDVQMSARLRPVDDDRTELDMSAAYRFPGGLAGRALAKVVEPFVRLAVRHVEHTVVKRVEAIHRQGA